MLEANYTSTQEDFNTVRDSLLFDGLEEEAFDSLRRIRQHMTLLNSMLDEAVHWLGLQHRFPKEEYGDFLMRYNSLKKDTCENGRGT